MSDFSAGADIRLAKEEDDPLDRYPPIVRYLQKLGPEYLSTIFQFSEWIFAEDASRGLAVCDTGLSHSGSSLMVDLYSRRA